jgi:hypothetical protein
MDKAGLLDPEYHYLLDHQYWLRLAKFGGLGYVPQVWAAARFHPTSKNVDQAAGFGQEAYSILNWMEMEPELAVLLKGIKREVQAGAHWLNARYLSEAGNTRASLSAYLRSFLTHPKFALRDWKRVLFTLTGIFGAGWLRSGYSKFLARKAFRE